MRFDDWNNDELYHHGIPKQRWGIRRFQNKDGSLTPAGRDRYLKNSKGLYKYAKDSSKLAKKSKQETNLKNDERIINAAKKLSYLRKFEKETLSDWKKSISDLTEKVQRKYDRSEGKGAFARLDPQTKDDVLRNEIIKSGHTINRKVLAANKRYEIAQKNRSKAVKTEAKKLIGLYGHKKIYSISIKDYKGDTVKIKDNVRSIIERSIIYSMDDIIDKK